MAHYPSNAGHNFFVNEKGIYWTESAYGDEIDHHYVVEFSKHDTNDQFQKFQKHLLEMGGNARGLQVLSLLNRGSRF